MMQLAVLTLFVLVGLLTLYWLIRPTVHHGILDAQQTTRVRESRTTERARS